MSQWQEALVAAAARLCAAQRPVILVGPEGAPAAQAIVEIAHRLGAPILTTPDAKSVIDHWHSGGTFSFGASGLARAIVERADLVLAISALGEFTCRLGEALRHHCVIQISDRVSDVGRNVQPSASLVGPAIADIVWELQRALALLIPVSARAWSEGLTAREATCPSLASKPGFIHPVAAIAAIQAALPEAARVCLDVTSGALHAYEHLKLTRQQRTFSSIENSACMGEALLASLGVRLASNLPTLALVGDWGYAMCPAEIHTAVELGLDRYVVLVWANGGGAFIGAGIAQQKIVVPDPVWRWRAPPHFAGVAAAYGARGVTVSDASSLHDELTRALGEAGPVLIEARIDPSAHVPAGDRFLTLGEARA
jgi:thiamine pyrophosphate-dependent acetolactate synthase large subunit-like protein